MVFSTKSVVDNVLARPLVRVFVLFRFASSLTWRLVCFVFVCSLHVLRDRAVIVGPCGRVVGGRCGHVVCRGRLSGESVLCLYVNDISDSKRRIIL